MFPVTDASQTIIDCLVREAERLGVEIRMQAAVRDLVPLDGGGFDLDGERFDKVIVATGGSPKREGLAWLEALGHTIVDPVPSLFTFNMPGESVTDLMGVVVPEARVRIQGTKLVQDGPVLITHWGMSGPAVLKLSAWGARDLAERNYHFTVQINWIGIPNEAEVAQIMDDAVAEMRNKKVANACPFELPKKFWAYLLGRAGIGVDAVWHELGKKAKNKLVNTLLNDVYDVRGKTTFKEEFVTCGASPSARSTSTRWKAASSLDCISRARCSTSMASRAASTFRPRGPRGSSRDATSFTNRKSYIVGMKHQRLLQPLLTELGGLLNRGRCGSST